jgi:hypothetical protein
MEKIIEIDSKNGLVAWVVSQLEQK